MKYLNSSKDTLQAQKQEELFFMEQLIFLLLGCGKSLVPLRKGFSMVPRWLMK